jgi:hypothetical protein
MNAKLISSSVLINIIFYVLFIETENKGWEQHIYQKNEDNIINISQIYMEIIELIRPIFYLAIFYFLKVTLL